MSSIGPSARRRRARPLTAALAAALLAALLFAGLALSAAPGAHAAKAGRPTAKAPKGSVASVKPTFKWSKARNGNAYELRIYKGNKLLLKKTRIKKRSWKSTKALPANVGLTWKVRARNASGAGAWSRKLRFRIAPPSSAKAITAFSFQGLAPPVTGGIDEAAHTIALAVPYNTARGALVATFTTTGASVTVAGTPQTSGVSANDFSSPVTYTVRAADGSTQAYLVTVTGIGDAYGGGIVAYIYQPGDPGYVAGQTHGLIAAAADQTGAGADDGIQWALPNHQATDVPGAHGTALGSGAANTTAIIEQNGAGTGYAAGLARAYAGGGYSDWYLPSTDELNKLRLNRAAIGGFHTAMADSPGYWSSSQDADFADAAWYQLFDLGYQSRWYKNGTYRVRAVRAF
jgi:hypothetical protein